ncbi:hypothetical protein TNCV_2851591 [Trichonephila clavipes]|nr:hypothetical protein TNCV_2851591 [Trichonephila clavipes]
MKCRCKTMESIKKKGHVRLWPGQGHAPDIAANNDRYIPLIACRYRIANVTQIQKQNEDSKIQLRMFGGTFGRQVVTRPRTPAIVQGLEARQK